MLAATVRQHRFAHGARDLAHHRNGMVLHARQHGLRRGVPPGGRKRHHPVRQRECRQAIADPRLGEVRDLAPAIADVDPVALEAKEHRRRILDIDVEVRHLRDEGRREVAEAPVVKIEHRFELAPLEVEHRPVPPQVVHEVVDLRPVRLEAGEPRYALLLPALHLEDVRHRVRAPAVGGIELDGAPAGALGGGVLAAFLQAEREARKHDRIGAESLGPACRDALDRGAHVLAPAEPEVVEVRKAQREDIGRMRGEDLLPQLERALQVAGAPCAERLDVGFFSTGRTRRMAPGDFLSFRHLWCYRRLVHQHHQVALGAVAKGELRVGGKRGAEMLRHVDAVAGVGAQRAVEGFRRRGRARADRKAVQVALVTHGGERRITHMRDSSSVSYGEAMRRAREIVPVLRSRAQKCEDARVLLPENETLLHETGLFRYHQPKRFGGMELPFIAVVDIVAELARGCPSTAWNVGNLGCHHWILAYYDPKTQHEVWDANPDALIASSIALAAGRGRKVDGGFVVSGRWPFSSGVDNSQWNMLAVTIYENEKAVDWRLCLVPKKDYTIIDTWYAMGMVGTGSKDIEVNEVFVPERRALSLPRCRGGLEHPGATLNNGRLFRIPIVAAAGHPLSPTVLGAAEGAFEHVQKSFAKRVGTYTGAKVSEFQAVQIKLARARALIDSARYLMRGSAMEFEMKE